MLQVIQRLEVSMAFLFGENHRHGTDSDYGTVFRRT